MKKYVVAVVAGLLVGGFAVAQQNFGFTTFTIQPPITITPNGLAVRLLTTPIATTSPYLVLGEQATSTTGNRLEVIGSAYISDTLNVAKVIATSSLTITNIASGNCLQTSTGGLIVSAGAACGTGGGGGTDGNWTFFNGSGIRLSTTTNQVLIDGTSTTTNHALEVLGTIWARDNLAVGTGTPGTVLSITGAGGFTEHVYAKFFVATSSTDRSVFPIASTTSFSVGNLLSVAGLGTSTFAGALDVAGNQRVQGNLNVLGAVNLPIGSIPNQTLSNSSLTVTAGTCLNGGGGIALGAAATLNVTSNCTDAATVDSIEGASLLRSDVSDAYTSGTLTFNAGTTGIVQGSWGFATGTPGTALAVTGSGVVTESLTARIFKATSTQEANIFPIASSTSISLSNLLNVSGLGTSTMAGSLLVGTTAGSFGVGTSAPTSDYVGNFAGRLLWGGSGATSTNIGNELINGNLTIKGNLELLGACKGCPAGAGGTPGGATGEVQFNSTGSFGASNQLFWDNSAFRLGIGTGTPGTALSVTGAGVFTDRLTATHFVATSTSLASLFPVASSTSFSVADGLNVLGRLTIPNATDPVIDRIGLIALNTTAASSSLRFNDGTAERALYPTRDKSIVIASSTAFQSGAYKSGTTGTTTLTIANHLRPVTIVAIYCKTDVGTAAIDFHDGTNHTEALTCNTAGTRDDGSIANASWVSREDFKLDIGNGATNPNLISISVTIREDAD